MFFLLAFLFSGAFDDIISEVVGDVVDLMQLAVAFVAKYLFTNVVVSDGLVAIIAGLWRRQKCATCLVSVSSPSLSTCYKLVCLRCVAGNRAVERHAHAHACIVFVFLFFFVFFSCFLVATITHPPFTPRHRSLPSQVPDEGHACVA